MIAKSTNFCSVASNLLIFFFGQKAFSTFGSQGKVSNVEGYRGLSLDCHKERQSNFKSTESAMPCGWIADNYNHQYSTQLVDLLEGK